MKRIIHLVSLAILFSASSVYSQTPQQATANLDYQVAAVLYQQKAAEYRALAYQAFNLARLRLDADLDKRNSKNLPKAERDRPRAIIVDIDETVLDNSPAQAQSIKTGRPFNMPDWYAWGKLEKAKAIAGAVEFLNYAVSNGVKVFYVSNRDEAQKPETMVNLTKAGFRDIGTDNVLLRQKDANGRNISTKTPRRSFIAEEYRVVLVMGDNLDDFSDVFEHKSVADRFAETDRYKDEWGKLWIVLPNAMYGSWENAIYDHKPGDLTEEQKAEKRAAALEMP